MRRALLPLLAALAVLAIGCQESGFDESKETSKPLKVQHALGETKVPGQAVDPLTLTVDTLDDTLALDVPPARAAVPGAKLPDYLRSAGRGVSTMQPVTESDLPAVEAVHPDLILGSARQGRLYEDLSRIAPTVMIDGSGSQWKLDLRLVGEALGRTNDAEGLLTDYDRDVADTRAAISGKPTVAVARMTADGKLEYAPRDSFAGTILSDVGLKQVRGSGADVTLREDVWWSAGGALAARAALADLRDQLGG